MLKPLDPQNKKYHKFYTSIAELAAKQSVAVRRKVGAVIVLESGLIAIGYNGTPSGFDNECEYVPYTDLNVFPHIPKNLVTKPEVIHAERNALDKLTRQGLSTEGAILFVTTAPCLECAKSLASVGIREIYYRDVQSNIKGLKFLKEAGVPTFKYGE